MKTSTRSIVTHRTSVTAEEKRTDGGRSLLLELFDDVHGDKRVGKLTAQLGVGGSLSSLIFEETESIKQGEIEVESPAPTIRYLSKVHDAPEK
jgi:hypothetical protein